MKNGSSSSLDNDALDLLLARLVHLEVMLEARRSDLTSSDAVAVLHHELDVMHKHYQQLRAQYTQQQKELHKAIETIDKLSSLHT